MPAPLPDDKRAAILADIKAGTGTCRGIARKHGVSRSTVSKIASDAGLTNAFGRQQTKAATEARIADAAAERASLVTASLAAAKAALARMYEDLSQASARDAAVIFGIAVDKHLALERHNSGADADRAASLLGAILSDLQARHGDTPSE